MLTPQLALALHSELVVDLFAGGGGASTGIEQAIGRAVDIAINHDPEAISLHQANHPQTRHFCSDVFEVDPISVTNGQPVGLLWASPDCKHFSKAKGGKPVSRKIRSLAWVVVKWAKAVRPRVICLENVEEFQTWGPLGADQKPCPIRKGETFQKWVESLRKLGYKAEWKELRACDYGAPTIRKRLFLVARCDGAPIEWPQPTHTRPDTNGKTPKGLKPWRTAADCIDWNIKAPSIFERNKPLADATCRRIAKGIMRYVVESAHPFFVNTRNGEREGQHPRVRSINEPYWTITGLGSQGAIAVPTIAPVMTEIANASSPRCMPANEPLRTITAETKGGHHALVTAFLAKHYTGVIGSDLQEPIGTITSVDHHSLVSANLVARGKETKPNEQNDHLGDVYAFLVKYYGNERDGVELSDPMHTTTTRDKFGLVTVNMGDEAYFITDIGLRMLTPRELYRAQGFPETYQIDTGHDGEAISKTAQVRMCGNSVCPPMAKLLVQANYAEKQAERKAA